MKKILMVDDSRTINKLLSNTIVEAGYDVISAFNVDEAIAALKSHSDIKLIITDLIMPGDKDGHDLIDYVHNTSLAGVRPRIIAISGGSAGTVTADTAVQSVAHRVEKVLMKPFTPKDLIYYVNQQILA